MRFRGSLASRVALLAAVAVLLMVAFGAMAAYALVRHQLIADLDRSLARQAKVAANNQPLRLAGRELDTVLIFTDDPRLMWIRADGTVLDRLPETGWQLRPSGEEIAVAADQIEQTSRTVYLRGEGYRIIAVDGAQDGTALIYGKSLRATEETLGRLGFLLTIFGLLGVVGAGFAGWLVARNGLSPVRRLSAAVEEIARTQRLDPIPVEGNDEVATLADSFNRMLAALAASQARQRQLVADAGHELRTPLTSLRTNIDLLAQAEGRGGLSRDAHAELMDDLRFQIEELTTLIGDLTELARDDPAPAELAPVDLAEVVSRGLERVRRRATGVHFEVQLEPWPVDGEAPALERAVTNLLDNAVKWSPPGGVVTVRLEQGVLLVADQGPGIAEDDLPHVFERFYRSPESRTMPGSGLGLSIVRAVAERHGGMVRVGRSPEGGAAFWLWIPPPADAVTKTTATSHQA